jgi:uncharacterized protein YqeY
LNKIKLLEISKREVGGEVTDTDVVAVIQKMIKELEEEKANYIKVANSVQADLIQTQIDIISSYLPQMMSEQEIYDIIAAMDDKSVPTVMKKFKAEFAGKCDMRLVGEVLKKFN